MPKILILIAIVFAIAFPCSAPAKDDAVKPAEIKLEKSTSPFVRMDFQVKANCVSCVRRVTKALKSIKGVITADVSIYNPHWAVVVIDTAQTDELKVLERIKKEKVEITAFEKQDLKEKPFFVMPKTDAPKRM